MWLCVFGWVCLNLLASARFHTDWLQVFNFQSLFDFEFRYHTMSNFGNNTAQTVVCGQSRPSQVTSGTILMSSTKLVPLPVWKRLCKFTRYLMIAGGILELRTLQRARQREEEWLIARVLRQSGVKALAQTGKRQCLVPSDFLTVRTNLWLQHPSFASHAFNNSVKAKRCLVSLLDTTLVAVVELVTGDSPLPGGKRTCTGTVTRQAVVTQEESQPLLFIANLSGSG